MDVQADEESGEDVGERRQHGDLEDAANATIGRGRHVHRVKCTASVGGWEGW